MQHSNSNIPAAKGLPWSLLGVILIFAIPFLLAILLFLFPDKVHFKYNHSGQLLNPPLLIKTDIALSPLSAQLGKWQLVYLEPKGWDTSSLARLDTLKRIHQALGKDQNRVLVSSLPFTEANLSYATENSILIIDPKGFVIMVYPSTSLNGKGLLEDMRRLLKFSHVG